MDIHKVAVTKHISARWCLPAQTRTVYSQHISLKMQIFPQTHSISVMGGHCYRYMYISYRSTLGKNLTLVCFCRE